MKIHTKKFFHSFCAAIIIVIADTIKQNKKRRHKHGQRTVMMLLAPTQYIAKERQVKYINKHCLQFFLKGIFSSRTFFSWFQFIFKCLTFYFVISFATSSVRTFLNFNRNTPRNTRNCLPLFFVGSKRCVNK